MPADIVEDSETAGSGEQSQDHDTDRDKDKNGLKTKGGNNSQAQAKAKDLSHVPCKFFKLGQCTAGSSCPFSHHVVEPGQQKDVCQWFLKGNCKFGHKCALAHILPGQPMSMDRKNKKTAQQQAQAAGGAAAAPRAERRKAGSSNKEESLRIGIGRLGRGGGSAAPTTISPSAPAPPLRDTDFPFGLPDDFTQPVQTQAKASQPGSQSQSQSQSQSDSNPATTPAVKPSELFPTTPSSVSSKQGGASSPPQQDTQGQTSPLPLSRPNTSRVSRSNGSGDYGFGPIGSPPRSSPGHTPISQPISSSRINGFSPSTSPNAPGSLASGMPLTSPFSAPGSKSPFMAYSLDRDASASTQIRATSGPIRPVGAMSLGGLGGWDMGSSALGGSQIEEGEMEEFLPSSLTELLTDEERKRRLSRTGGQRPVIEPHHRYSRSVPAASLMDNVKSLWNENNADAASITTGLSPSFLGTSNVSTGFLPRRPPSNNITSSTRLLSDTQVAAQANNNVHFGLHGRPGSPSASGGIVSPPMPSLFSLNRTSSQPHSPATSVPQQHFDLQQPRPIPSTRQGIFGGNNLLSPTARALQEHAPGQSLPQGLAAGLSRIHIRPPGNLGTSISPHHSISGLSSSPNGRGGMGSIGMGMGMSSGGGYSGTEYTGGFAALSQNSPSASLNRDSLERMTSFGSRGGGAGMNIPGVNANPPTAIGNSGTVGGGGGVGLRGRWSSHPLSSPLSGPVITNDDDEVFTMDAMDEPPH